MFNQPKDQAVNLNQMIWSNVTQNSFWALKSSISAIFTTMVLTRSSNHPEYEAHILVLNSAHWQIVIAVTHEPEPYSSKSYHPTFYFFTGSFSTVPHLLLWISIWLHNWKQLTQLSLIHAIQTPLHASNCLKAWHRGGNKKMEGARRGRWGIRVSVNIEEV